MNIGEKTVKQNNMPAKNFFQMQKYLTTIVFPIIMRYLYLLKYFIHFYLYNPAFT